MPAMTSNASSSNETVLPFFEWRSPASVRSVKSRWLLSFFGQFRDFLKAGILISRGVFLF